MPARVYSLTTTYNNAGEFSQTVHKFQFDDSGYTDTASAANALITAYISNKLPHVKNILPTHVQVLSFKSRAIEGGGGFEAVQLATGVVTGVRTGNQQNSAVGPVALWGPANNAKARGKTFWPGVSDTDCVDGIFTSTYEAVFATEMTAFLADMVLAGGAAPTAVFGIYQRKPVISFLPAVYAHLVQIPGTLRKRQRPA
jgi:hypothetical protein